MYSCKDNPSEPSYSDNPGEVHNIIFNYTHFYNYSISFEFGYFTKNYGYISTWVPLVKSTASSSGEFTIKPIAPPDSILKGIKSVFNDPELKTSNANSKVAIMSFCLRDLLQSSYMVEVVKLVNIVNSLDTVKPSSSVVWLYSDSNTDLSYVGGKTISIKKGYNVITLVWPVTSGQNLKIDDIIPAEAKWYCILPKG